MYRGFLAIPYLRYHPKRKWSAISIRFRCILEHEHRGHGKYMTVAGEPARLFNTPTMLKHSPFIAITEGELDAVTAQAVCGVPAVGVPGVETWKPHYPLLFKGYREVFVFADGDEAGMKFANTLAKQLPNAKVIPCPTGEDVNSLVLSRGKSALLERIT